MGFGENVSTLLEAYDNCLSLLKAFKRQKKHDGGRKVSKASDQQVLLKRSLKLDRTRVQKAYSSRLSESGSRFEQGDSKAKSALSKVLKRLNAVIAGLIRVASKSSDPAMDYQSLMSLSNSSRIQAIKAFDSLSQRLGSKSSLSSVASTSTSRSSKSSTSSKSSKSSKSSQSKSSSSGTSSRTKDNKSKKRAKVSKTRSKDDGKQLVKASSRRQDEGPSPPPLPTSSIPTPLLDLMECRDEGRLLGRRPSTTNRFSLVSISSGSTKLGEIPESRWRRRYGDDWDGGSGDYNAHVVYPLRPFQPVAKERRFLGLFRRGN